VRPDEVLKLIASAPERYDSVRAALRYQGDGPTKKEIRERIVRTEAGRRAFGISPRKASERTLRPIDHPEPDGPFGWRSRAWHADEYHWRLEADRTDGGVNILASNGWTPSGAPPPGPQYMGRFWRHRVGGGSREDDPRWFDLANDHYWTFYALRTDEICGISHELRPLDLTVEGTVVWVGREAVRLVGVPGEEWDWEWDPDPLYWGADEYEVVVDAERGVLLRCASRLGGKDFDALEVEEIHFDERFGENVFTSRQPLSRRS
jgi:hypothetical protein